MAALCIPFLKASEHQDGHAACSDPVDEQHFLVNTLNEIQQSTDWDSTAIFVAYDGSDGWYDHVTLCGSKPAAGGYADRCGYGPRLPLLTISPFSKTNFADHTVTDQSSILKFIEDNWGTGRIGDSSFDARAGSVENMFDFHGPKNPKPVLLDPATGSVVSKH